MSDLENATAQTMACMEDALESALKQKQHKRISRKDWLKSFNDESDCKGLGQMRYAGPSADGVVKPVPFNLEGLKQLEKDFCAFVQTQIVPALVVEIIEGSARVLRSIEEPQTAIWAITGRFEEAAG